jgi:hypothetical protein
VGCGCEFRQERSKDDTGLLPFAEDDMDFGLRIRKQADLVLWRAELPARANDFYADPLGCQPHDFALELVTHFWRGLLQWTACGKQRHFAVWRLHQPENSDVRRLARSCSGHAITMPFARARYVVGLLSWASAFSNSCLTPSASAGARPEFPQGMAIALALIRA